MKRFIEAMAVEELDEEEPAPGAAEGEGGPLRGAAQLRHFTGFQKLWEGLAPAVAHTTQHYMRSVLRKRLPKFSRTTVC